MPHLIAATACGVWQFKLAMYESVLKPVGLPAAPPSSGLPPYLSSSLGFGWLGPGTSFPTGADPGISAGPPSPPAMASFADLPGGKPLAAAPPPPPSEPPPPLDYTIGSNMWPDCAFGP